MSQLAFDINEISRTGIKEKEKIDVLTGGRYIGNLNGQWFVYSEKSISPRYVQEKWRYEMNFEN